ncbi:hypothetical protein [Pseudanabaena sp. 'Roaring Creek']|uniref:hypothetical protein n=1 Tax=Pseudanabaena sp. 'Roaring Creek' TaxID=1681830 RepID=UPI0006D78974|nr:hypothetical protein [Pseudanabaena sp. 'Roaring Creek']
MNLILTKLLPVAALALSLSGSLAIPVFAQSNVLIAKSEQRLDLHLTSEQKVKIKKIESDAHDKVKKLLTADQLKQLNTALSKKGESFRHALSTVRLTDEQHDQVLAIKKEETAAQNAVLTPDQLKILKAYIDSHKNH